MLTVGDKFPSFSLKAVTQNDHAQGFPTITDKDQPGKWKVFFFWPKDFTFICPTELISFGELYQQFQQKNAQLYGCSTDSDYVHLAWRNNHPGLRDLPYPMLSDIKKELSTSLGILHRSEGVCLRATYIVDPEGIIRHVSINDLSVGRNTEETLRILSGLQSEGLCGCNWKPGEAHIKAA
jgi:alkyl hydroperoxide reductase subunit AhpC